MLQFFAVQDAEADLDLLKQLMQQVRDSHAPPVKLTVIALAHLEGLRECSEQDQIVHNNLQDDVEQRQFLRYRWRGVLVRQLVEELPHAVIAAW